MIKSTDLTPVAYDSIDWLKETELYYLASQQYAFADGNNFMTVSIPGDDRLYITYYECSKSDKSDPVFEGTEEKHTLSIENYVHKEYYQCSKVSLSKKSNFHVEQMGGCGHLPYKCLFYVKNV